MKHNWIARGAVAILAVSAVGCGDGFKSGANGGGIAAASIQSSNDSVAKAEAAQQSAIQAMSDANDAIASISDSNGNINMNLFKSSGSAPVQTQGLLAPLVAKLQPIFDGVFAKVSDAKAKFDLAKSALAAALAKLGPNDPLVSMLTQKLADISAMEANFLSQVHALAGKLDIVKSSLDKLVSMATSFIPIPGLGMIAGMLVDMLLLDDVKNLISSLQSKLLAL